jgi:hypothetical protein
MTTSRSEARTGPQLYDAAHTLLSQDAWQDEDEWMEALDRWANECEDKLQAYRAVSLAARDRADSLRAAAQAYEMAARRQDRCMERVEKLAKLVLTALGAVGGTVVSCPDGTQITIRRRRSTAVEVDDLEMLMPEFLRVRRAPNKTAIKRAFQAGQLVAGARLVERVHERVHWGI